MQCVQSETQRLFKPAIRYPAGRSQSGVLQLEWVDLISGKQSECRANCVNHQSCINFDSEWQRHFRKVAPIARLVIDSRLVATHLNRFSVIAPDGLLAEYASTDDDQV